MKQYKNKKVLVTGGAGFIGSHLVDALVTSGAQVTVLDNLSTGKKENLAQSIDNITFIEGDIRNSETCIEAAKGCEYIFHLAAFISVPGSIAEPGLCNEINVVGTFNLLEAARQNKVNRFVFSSSSAVYGQEHEDCSETTPCKPLSPYGHSKWLGEMLCQQYAGWPGVKSICLRYFNVIGSRQNPHGPYAGVYAKFSHLMKQNKPVTIFGDGKQSRDFISVAKIVEANLLLAQLPQGACDGSAVNIGTGTPTTVQQLFNQLKSLFPDYHLEPLFAPSTEGGIYYSCADIQLYEKLKNTLQDY